MEQFALEFAGKRLPLARVEPSAGWDDETDLDGCMVLGGDELGGYDWEAIATDDDTGREDKANALLSILIDTLADELDASAAYNGAVSGNSPSGSITVLKELLEELASLHADISMLPFVPLLSSLQRASAAHTLPCLPATSEAAAIDIEASTKELQGLHEAVLVLFGQLWHSMGEEGGGEDRRGEAVAALLQMTAQILGYERSAAAVGPVRVWLPICCLYVLAVKHYMKAFDSSPLPSLLFSYHNTRAQIDARWVQFLTVHREVEVMQLASEHIRCFPTKTTELFALCLTYPLPGTALAPPGHGTVPKASSSACTVSSLDHLHMWLLRGFTRKPFLSLLFPSLPCILPIRGASDGGTSPLCTVLRQTQLATVIALFELLIMSADGRAGLKTSMTYTSGAAYEGYSLPIPPEDEGLTSEDLASLYHCDWCRPPRLTLPRLTISEDGGAGVGVPVSTLETVMSAVSVAFPVDHPVAVAAATVRAALT
jgi:hypothetical protein